MIAALALVLAPAQEPVAHPPRSGYAPPVAEASREAAAALERMELTQGLRVELFAAEPLVANPVCLDVDRRGDVYVGETFRHHAGVTDIRDHMAWLDDDLAARTVADRVAMYRRHLGEGFEAYGREHERVRLVRDLDGDGVADEARVFADGFDDPAAGIGASLLARDEGVYYTCIPDLWRLRDRDGDGHAEEREALSTGYGVHVALLGHDLHGLELGPDLRLYFSCGDRGFTVATPDGVLEHADTGAVLRCELDGGGLQVFATGLRNPQDLAFDDHGELFTGDNNSDGGDRARLVHVVEGGDSGWRYSYQWLGAPHVRGPWNAEKLWIPAFEGQAAYLVPPVANLADGPSGFERHPGTGLLPGYEQHFFLVDFRGSSRHSGIHAFTLEPRGASFALGPVAKLLWSALPTDCAFGPDGALYVCDWVEGWNKTGKGRVYRVLAREDGPHVDAARRTQRLLAEGMDGRLAEELASLLGDADRRVRLEAQLALARRADGFERLLGAARAAPGLVARLHGLWGSAAWARWNGGARAEELAPLLSDPEPLVRAQAAKSLGELAAVEHAAKLVGLLADADARVRLQATLALGKAQDPRAVESLMALVREVGQSDPALRHGAIVGLAGCAEPAQLAALAEDPCTDARVAAVVALRRQASPLVARFLDDGDPRVALEAARAVHDAPIPEALPALAALAVRHDDPHFARRALAASFCLGSVDDAARVAAVAAEAERDALLRREALELLATWRDPPGRDPFLGAWRPLQRDARLLEELREALPQLARELASAAAAAEGPVAGAWLALVEAEQVRDLAPRVAELSRDPQRPAELRARALATLGALEPHDLLATVRAALADAEPAVRAAALDQFARLAPAESLGALDVSLREGGRDERRAAYRALAEHPEPRAGEVLADELRLLDADLVPAEVALELVQAAERRGGTELETLLAQRVARRAADPELAPWLDALHGGDAARGRALFRGKVELACLRCHRAEDEGASDVGPDLQGVGARLTRLQLAEAIVAPDRTVAPGRRATVFLLDDETLVDGQVLDEDGERALVLRPDGERVEVPLAQVVERRAGLSAMPGGLGGLLTREELRDLVEYLSGL